MHVIPDCWYAHQIARKLRWYVAAGLMTLLIPAARPADEPLKISVYAPAETVNRYLNTSEGRQEAVTVLKRFRVSKVYVEGNRGDVWVPVDLLRSVRDDFASKGIETSGGVGPLPGKTFGVHVSGRQPWLDYRAEKTQRDVARAFTESAAVFDEMIVDDFYCFDEGTVASRLELLVRLIDPMMLRPARAVRPSFRLIIKIPQWYDRLQEYGYEPVGMTAASERIWVGTETRNPETRNTGYVQPMEGYVNFRWLSSVAGSKIGGAWFDFIDCTAQNYLDQAYQSVLAGARELTLFNLGNLMRGHPGQPLFQAALPKLFDLAEKVRGRPASGIAYYKPSGSDGEENLYLMEYLPMVGLPIVPVAKFPSDWPVIFLGSQAAADRDLLASMKRELARGATLILTPALLRRMDPQAGSMAGVTVSPRLQPGVAGGMEVDLGLAVTRAQTRVSIPAEGKSIPLLTMRKNGRGRILVANVRAFSAADWPIERSEKLFPPLKLGLPYIAQPLADSLRRDMLEPLKTSLAAPSRVAFYMLGDARVLYNFRDEPVEVKLDGKAIQVPANGLVWR